MSAESAVKKNKIKPSLGTENAFSGAGSSIHDARKKLSELQTAILSKGITERDQILDNARTQAAEWLSENNANLDAMVLNIHRDSAHRAQELTTRQLVEAESVRDKDLMRLQSDMVRQALVLFQNELTDLAARIDYDAILTGIAAEVCEKLNPGRVGIRLNRSDARLGDVLVQALSLRFPGFEFYFDETPEPILGGVVLFSEEEKWRVTADWKSKVDEIKEDVATAIMAEL